MTKTTIKDKPARRVLFTMEADLSEAADRIPRGLLELVVMGRLNLNSYVSGDTSSIKINVTKIRTKNI
jgi:hypothetical protein